MSIEPRLKEDSSEESLRKRIVEAAESLVGKPYLSDENRDGVVCIDVYVKALEQAGIGIEQMIREDYAASPRRYSNNDTRFPLLVRQAKGAVDHLRKGGRKHNTPADEFFTRMIQNVVAYQKAHGLFYKPGKVTPKLGMAVYFSRNKWWKGLGTTPDHVGIISKLSDDGRIFEVIETSNSFNPNSDNYKNGRVVRVPFSYITNQGYHLAGFGDAPLDKAKE